LIFTPSLVLLEPGMLSVYEAFSNSLLALPKMLAMNAALDSFDTVASLRFAHQQSTERSKYKGINLDTGEVDDMVEMVIIEPHGVKMGAISLAVETAIQILRIDQIISPHSQSQK